MSSHNNPKEVAARIARLVLDRPGMSRAEIVSGLRDQAKAGVHDFDHTDNTVYRWLNHAIEASLIERQGNTAGARYFATPEMRIKNIRETLARPVSTRPKVGYNERFLYDYKPNESSLLSPTQLTRLMSRCPPGSAKLSLLGDHDVSVFLCDLSFSSSRLEGNEYDYASTYQLIEHHIEKTGGSRSDKVMILNHRDAIRFILDNMSDQDLQQQSAVDLRASDVRALHSMLSSELMKNPADCGALRRSHVEIRDSSYIPPDLPSQIETLFRKVLDTASQIENPFEQAFFLVVHLPYLQPFEDCNKRTARVACNIPLLRAGVTPMSWVDVPMRDYIDGILGVYELNDVSLLSEVFVEGFLRSSERFALMRKTRDPEQIATDYRYEIRQAIRARVVDDDRSIPHNIPEDRADEFARYLDEQVEALLENPFSGARFGLREHEVSAFQQREAARSMERQSA